MVDIKNGAKHGEKGHFLESKFRAVERVMGRGHHTYFTNWDFFYCIVFILIFLFFMAHYVYGAILDFPVAVGNVKSLIK